MNKKIERLFQASSGILLISALYFAYVQNFERVFVFATVGALCFFIGIRFQVKERLRVRDEEREFELNELTSRPAHEDFEERLSELDTHQ